jgi:glycosyltransferase involved in cell wall biosynthesis
MTSGAVYPPHDCLTVKVLLLSAYAAQSHVYWRRSLQAMFDQWQWQVLSLPPRHFSWRVRGNPLYWAMAERGVLERHYDLLIATSMVDLATLRGLVPALARLPSILYFHENQFGYPSPRQQHGLLEAQMVSLYSALAADSLLFNSAYNRDSFLAGSQALLDKLPDRVPPGIVPVLRDKSAVLPVPLEPDGQAAQWPGQSGELPARPLRLLWVGRFEHDKGGDHLLAILLQLEQGDMPYELAVVGQQFRNSPDVYRQIATEFGHRIVQFGYVQPAATFKALLRAADIVLSTALHEFQGLAVMEAVASGCLPAVPRRQAYPEIYPARYCYASHPNDPELEARCAASLIRELALQLAEGSAQAPDVAHFSRRQLAPRYRDAFLALVGAQHSN